MTGKPISAERAHQLGIVSNVYPAAELIAEVEKLGAQFAASAPLALRGIMDAIVYGEDMPLTQGLDYESQTFGLLSSTADMREGTRAFLEKRKPEFVGR